jgi:hypothetical protein
LEDGWVIGGAPAVFQEVDSSRGALFSAAARSVAGWAWRGRSFTLARRSLRSRYICSRTQVATGPGSVRLTYDLSPAVAVAAGEREKGLRVEKPGMAPGRDLPIVHAEDLFDLILAKVSRPE